jgi:thiol-disulfide isomerase/thioredoxin
MFGRLAQLANEDGKQVAVLFSADWCEPCRHLELELGNVHAASKIGKFRILELKEEDWMGASRMNEFNALRKRWYAKTDSYPVFILLDPQEQKIEEMKEAIDRLTAAGLEPTVSNWFANVAS